MVVRREGMERPIFMDLMRTHYGTTASKMADALAGDAEAESEELEHNLDAIEADDIHRMAEEPLINLVNPILLEAIQKRASDVHVEPFENTLTSAIASMVSCMSNPRRSICNPPSSAVSRSCPA